MKYILAISAAAFSTLCATQGLSLNDLPDCAKPCAATLPAQCGISVQCICSDKDWITGISCCVKSKCPAEDQKKTVDVAQQICDTANVKLPTAATCPGDSTTGAGSGGSSSSTGTSSGNTGSSTMMGSSTMTGSSMSGTRTASAMSGSSTMGSTATSPSAATAPTPATGAGTQHLAPGVGAGAAILGLALL